MHHKVHPRLTNVYTNLLHNFIAGIAYTQYIHPCYWQIDTCSPHLYIILAYT